MKNLQEKQLTTAAIYPTRYIETLPTESPDSYILLLHGLNERGLRIHRKLIDSLPKNAHIVAPNAPFPLPRFKADRIDYGYTWYFYNKFSQSYDIDQVFAVSALKELIRITNPHKLPVTIIGFSQGGYLAPVLAYELDSVKQIIGIGCEFRPIFFKDTINYDLIGIHGIEDEIIPLSMAKNCILELEKKNISAQFIEVSETKHEISKTVAHLIKEMLEDGKKSL